jgi:hypothetical protein
MNMLNSKKVNALPALCSSVRLQPTSGEELRPLFRRTLMPSVLDRAVTVRERGRFAGCARSLGPLRALLPSHKGMISVLDKDFKRKL